MHKSKDNSFWNKWEQGVRKSSGELKTEILRWEIENFQANHKGVGREGKVFQAKGMTRAKFLSLETSFCLHISKADLKGSSVKCWDCGQSGGRLN